MIQFNLLPDVKKEYVKAKRAKRLIITSSLFASAIAVVVVLLLFSIVQIAQKKHIKDLSADIKAAEGRIQNVEGIDNVLSVQNQLSLLPSLHEQKPKTSRLFDYVKFASPATLSVSTLDLSVKDSTLVLQGSADAISVVNTFVDNLKATTYMVKSTEGASLVAAYTKISTQLTGDNKGTTFKISMSFDPVLFDNTKEIQMNIGLQSFSTDGEVAR